MSIETAKSELSNDACWLMLIFVLPCLFCYVHRRPAPTKSRHLGLQAQAARKRSFKFCKSLGRLASAYCGSSHWAPRRQPHAGCGQGRYVARCSLSTIHTVAIPVAVGDDEAKQKPGGGMCHGPLPLSMQRVATSS